MKTAKSLLALLLALLLMLPLGGAALAEEAEEAEALATANLRYVRDYFGVSFDDSITAREFGKAIESTTGLEVKTDRSDAPVAYENAVIFAMQAAGLGEFALTYTVTKAEAILTNKEIMTEADDVARQYLAAAIDCGLADADLIAANEALTPEQAADLLCAAAERVGEGRQYLGRIEESDILQKVLFAYNTAAMPDDEGLVELGNNAVKEQVGTGYNIRSAAYDSRFENSLTLRYGHSSIEHALQLLALLDSEGFSGYVNLEPKTSAYQYLLEWGPVPDPSPGYYVEEVEEDFYICFALEYDLVFEFDDVQMLTDFDAVINSYAKKNSGDPEGKALLISSWWQPYYFADHELGSEYEAVKDNVVVNGAYSLHTTSLNESAEAAQEWYKDNATRDMDVELVDYFVNKAFFRYLNGESE